MLGQLDFKMRDKVETSIEWIQKFEPEEGYYLAFSGGKDSVCIKALVDMAGVKYDAHYNITTVDPPELVQFIKNYHPDVVMEKALDKHGKQITMWNLIEKKYMPPTRIVRYCCSELKERGGEGRFVMTGIRWSESARRKGTRDALEIDVKRSGHIRQDPDNPESEELVRYCKTKGKHILNPIIFWEDDDVWEFIKSNNLPYCSLYDQGYKRLGCVGCPMSTNQKNELNQYPQFKRAYLRAFDAMLEKRRKNGKEARWKTAQDVYDWWVNGV